MGVAALLTAVMPAPTFATTATSIPAATPPAKPARNKAVTKIAETKAADAKPAENYEQEIASFAIEAPRVQALMEQAFAAEIGRGQTRSALRAAMLYCDAAREGSPEAYYRLGRLFLTGNGVPKSQNFAANLFSIAAMNGHQRAHDALELTGVRDDLLPECLTNPEAAWATIGVAGYADIERVAMALPKGRGPIADIIRRLAPQFGVDTRFALAIAAVESNFNPLARSPKNAQGVMQLIPATAARFNVADPFDPEQNIRGGLAYLKWLLKRFNGDMTLAAAGYNAGEGNVDRYKGVPPFAETQAYVRRINRFMPPPDLNEVRRGVRGGLPP
jgi:hypothetical protein